MKLEKAIEILTCVSHEGPEPDYDEYLEATNLGIEALKLMLEWRKALPKDNPCFIPGETED